MKKKTIFLLCLILAMLLFLSSAAALRLPADMPTLAPSDSNAPDRFCRHANWDLVSTKQATCTEDGVIVRKCSTCGEEKSETTPALGHDLKWRGHWDPAPSCTVDGYHLNTCSRCDYTTRTIGEYAWGHAGYTKRQEPTCTEAGRVYLECDQCYQDILKETLPALGHNYEQVGVKTPTCIENGAYYLQCTRCGDEKTEKRPATGDHAWSQIGFEDATCTEPGYYVLQCTQCSKVEKQKAKDALGHTWKKSATNPYPTCTQEGTQHYTCERLFYYGCTATKTETLPARGHQMEEVLAKGPTCYREGEILHRCKMCDYSYTEPVPRTDDHTYALEGEQKPTCTTDGGRMYRCVACENIKSEILKKTGHSWQQTYSEPATCAADGYKSYKCKNCSETKMETLPATGKCTWGNWITVTAASCNQDGLKVAECTVCGDTKQEVIPSEGVHDYKTTATKDPTCDQDGSKSYTCSKCGKTKTETLKATGHSWNGGTVTKEATCTAEGVKTFTCSKCSKTKTEAIKATGHNWQDGKVIKQATCTADGKASSVCTKCNATNNNRVIPKLGHSWGEWKVTKEATEKATGTKERVCKTCSAKETETIPKKTAESTKKPSSSSKSTAKLEAEYGTVEVFTTSGKVNLRSGPSKDNKRVTQVDKRNTNLGELLDAEADKKGVVWFKVKYKGKNGWITSDYAKAIVGELDGRTRSIDGKETELTNLYLKSVDEALDVLTLEDDGRYDIYETEVSNDAVLLCGNDYVEVIELTGEGYTIYGVKVGDKIKDAQKKFKKANLVLDYDSADEHVYHIICSQDSLFIDECGFDGTLTVVVADGKVESMRLEASSPAEE